MERERFSNDQVDQVLGQLLSGLAVFQAEVCSWLIDVDRGQRFLADGSPNLVQWLSARFGLRHERFAAGDLSLDQVDAISKMATADTEVGLIEECLGLSNAALDRAARRANPPTTQDEREMWERRCLFIQHSLDGLEGKLTAHLPGPDLHVVESAIRAGWPSSRRARSSQTRPPDGWPVMPWWSAPFMTMLALSASGG
jgi:hypothetical protein